MKKAVKMNKDEIVELIKGERSAVETYRQVFEKYASDAMLDELRGFSAQHKKATRFLLDEANSFGIETPESSGAWGSWAKAVTGTAKIFGKEAALKALKEGEEHGLKQYESVAKNDETPESIKKQIRNEFIPNQKRHIERIDSLMTRI